MSRISDRRPSPLRALLSFGGALCLAGLLFSASEPVEAQPSLQRSSQTPANTTGPPPRRSNAPNPTTRNPYITPGQFQHQQKRQQQQQEYERQQWQRQQPNWYGPHSPPYGPYTAPQYPGPNAPLPPAYPPSPYYSPYGPGGHYNPYYNPYSPAPPPYNSSGY